MHRGRRVSSEGCRQVKSKAVSGIMLALLLVGMLALAFNVQTVQSSPSVPLKIGIISDVHWMPEPHPPWEFNGTSQWVEDAYLKTENWTKEAILEWEEWEADFAIQLGDYVHEYHSNGSDCSSTEVLERQSYFLNSIWASNSTPLYNVLGNHEVSLTTKTEAVQLWPLPSNSTRAYYSFDVGDFHFIVLDNHDFEKGHNEIERGQNWRIWDEQKQWLINELENNTEPTFLFIHVPLAGIFEGMDEVISPKGGTYNSLRNGPEIRDLLEQYPHVVAVFQGHYHNVGSGTDDAWHWRESRVHYFGVPCPIDPNSARARGFLSLDPDNCRLTWDVISENFTRHYEFGWSHEVAITDVVLSKTVVGRGHSLLINATVKNQGKYTENFNVTVYANATVIDALVNITLSSRNSTTITFTWNTAGFAKGNYTITAYATPVPNETDTTDNTRTCWVVVAIRGT